jgi:hypothetical protein
MKVSNVKVYLTIEDRDFSVERIEGLAGVRMRKPSPYRGVTGDIMLPLEGEEFNKYANEIGILCRVLKAAERAAENVHRSGDSSEY